MGATTAAYGLCLPPAHLSCPDLDSLPGAPDDDPFALDEYAPRFPDERTSRPARAAVASLPFWCFRRDLGGGRWHYGVQQSRHAPEVPYDDYNGPYSSHQEASNDCRAWERFEEDER